MVLEEESMEWNDNQSFWKLCEAGDVEGVQAAIANGADVNEANEEGDVDAIAEAFENGEEFNEESDYYSYDRGSTGLMYALRGYHNNVVQILLEHPQIDVNKVDHDGRSALDWALDHDDNHEGVATLLARDDLTTTTINHRSHNGLTPIMFAVHNNLVKCFHLLLTNPLVDLDTRDNYRMTPQMARM